MSSCYITISYHIISNLVFSYLFCWLVLHRIRFNSIQFNFISNWFYSIQFDWILFIILYSIVSHINDRFVARCGCLSVSLFVCLSVWVGFFSVFLSLLVIFLSSLFLSVSWFLCFHESLPRTLTHGHSHWHTHEYEYMFLLMTGTYYLKSW